jgi:hypothetical protein
MHVPAPPATQQLLQSTDLLLLPKHNGTPPAAFVHQSQNLSLAQYTLRYNVDSTIDSEHRRKEFRKVILHTEAQKAHERTLLEGNPIVYLKQLLSKTNKSRPTPTTTTATATATATTTLALAKQPQRPPTQLTTQTFHNVHRILDQIECSCRSGNGAAMPQAIHDVCRDYFVFSIPTTATTTATETAPTATETATTESSYTNHHLDNTSRRVDKKERRPKPRTFPTNNNKHDSILTKPHQCHDVMGHATTRKNVIAHTDSVETRT